MNDAQRMQQTGGVNVHATGTPSVEHWKYPASVGNDTYSDNINFNSHESSEYAQRRMDNISETTHEPFMLLEMLTIDKSKQQVAGDYTEAGRQKANEALGTAGEAVGGTYGIYNNFWKVIDDSQLAKYQDAGREDFQKFDWVGAAGGWIADFFKKLGSVAQRNYTGSIALYMPTDIQINDQMVYNDDNRTLGALADDIFADGFGGAMDNFKKAVANPTVLTSPAALALTTGALGALGGGTSAAVGAVAGGAIGTAVRTELQRATGQVANPNELTAYASTALRTFTFNWTILPDSQYESDQAAGLIKFLRKSAHAKKDSSLIVTVPDHCVISFHGAKDMIQLPPLVIESVNVTYNPNNSSFFRRNNSPVEIGLSASFKEIAPIYQSDVEAGY
tara:strand:- start:242 stop:1414 length:1173 start_codon:yes stop_codon:yes gene_type:complete